MVEVVMYVTEVCPYCVRAAQLLERKQVQVKKIRVDVDPALKEEMIRLTGRYTVPQIFINQQPIGGCDDLYELERQGKLDELLNIKQ